MYTLEDSVVIVQYLGTATSVCNFKNNLDAIVELYLYEIQRIDFLIQISTTQVYKLFFLFIEVMNNFFQ